MQMRESQHTLVTLANVAEMASIIAQGIAGNELADTLQGSPLSRDVLYQLVYSKLQSHLAPFLGVN